MSKICVVGLGYIGLPTAAMLASAGHEVIGFDINADVVRMINAGQSHFREPDLDMLLGAAVQTGRLIAQTSPIEADYFIVAVPTPFKEGKKPDMSWVDAATDAIAPFLRQGSTVILESTSPVGTTERMTERLRSARTDLVFPRYKDQEVVNGQVHVCHCPERILPGQMVRELVSNDRIIGGMTDYCAHKAFELYDSFVKGTSFTTDCRTAEFVKLVENSYRDVNIAFANEVSLICEELDVDVWKAIDLANKHPRVAILKPGPGVGGHCIAVDPWFIVDSAPKQSRLIRLAREVNDDKCHHVLGRVLSLAERFRDPVIACYGLTYKPDVDDVRESPALEIVERLLSETQMRILVCDPMLKELPDRLKTHPSGARIILVDADAARQQSDICVFLVGHRKFRNLQPNMFLNKIVVDTIGMLSR
jgi:UDP-N-acetyl-D-mannosaminuronic acid dehydrogenase